MWCDLAGSCRTRTCDIFSFLFWLIKVLTSIGTFCWKPHLNWSSGSKVMSNWRILRTIENNRNSFLFLAIYLSINAADFRMILLDCNKYMYTCITYIFQHLVKIVTCPFKSLHLPIWNFNCRLNMATPTHRIR